MKTRKVESRTMCILIHKAGGSSTTLTGDPTKRVKVCAEI